MNEEQEREAFEAAYRAEWFAAFPSYSFDLTEDGQYSSGHMEAMWGGWILARAALPSAPAAPQPPAERVPLSCQEIESLIQTAWVEWDKSGVTSSYVKWLTRAIEAAHGITKEPK